jgi:vacuolar-type H+-ATPase subunit H
MPEEMYSTLRTIEGEAEGIITEAKTKARQILEEARKQSKAITAQEFSTDELEKERERIIEEAHKGVSQLIEDARKQATKLTEIFETQSAEAVKLILRHLQGQA